MRFASVPMGALSLLLFKMEGAVKQVIDGGVMVTPRVWWGIGLALARSLHGLPLECRGGLYQVIQTTCDMVQVEIGLPKFLAGIFSQ